MMLDDPVPPANYLDQAPTFTPVPMRRIRHDGWTPEKQQMFLAALAVCGVVDRAARSVGMTRKSAYNLRSRPGANSFAKAWDIAACIARDRAYAVLMDRALNGTTTIRVFGQGVVDIERAPDIRLARRALAADPIFPIR